jgi:hypothetical protein
MESGSFGSVNEEIIAHLGAVAGRPWLSFLYLANTKRYLIFSVFCLALAGCGLDQSTFRSDKPLSREAASKDESLSSFPFPASTTDVYYLSHAGGLQEYEFLVRFTVDQKDMDRIVSGLLLDLDKATHEHHFYSSASISDATPMPEYEEFQPIPWWSRVSLTNGFYYASTNSHPPIQVWADVTHHRIYLSETD